MACGGVVALMRKETFVTTESLDWTELDKIQAALYDATEQLAQDARDAGYAVLWQTLKLSTEEYAVDDITITGSGTVYRYNLLTAEVMGVKE